MSKEIIDQKLDQSEASENVELHGMFVSYVDDQLNERVKSTLKQKTRIKFNCLDTYSDYLAFGSSSGAIYLYRLDIPYHSSCELISMWPCDQGSIEAIKFIPESVNSDDPLIVIGTTKGSIVVFKFTINERAIIRNEIYKDKLSTNEECGVKILEGNNPFSKLYICDKENRLYVLDIDTIFSKNTFRVLCTDQKPSLLYVVEDSNINQISVHGSHLLISTNETTRFFDDQSPESKIIGKQQRKKGFYGACFFSDLETISIFVARPDFRLWQVNYNDELNVMFTHQFKSLIKKFKYPNVTNLQNKPLEEDEIDDPSTVMSSFTQDATTRDVISKNFQKIIPIFSKTLGNLLLSYTRNDIFVINPISAQLIVCYSQEIPIIQVCCNEREIFIWSLDIAGGRRHYELKRLVLLSPTQFVIELHRLNRFLTLIEFVEHFSDLFKSRMALPIHGPHVIKIDGGLLRNILINAWNVYNYKTDTNDEIEDENTNEKHMEFRKMIETILREGSQLKQSLENLTDSRFFIPISNENIDRLCSEPYASLVSLQICLKDLHLNNVIHFTKDAMNRHKSVINLSQSIQKLRSHSNLTTKSSFDLNTQTTKKDDVHWKKPSDKVIVERHKPKRNPKLQMNQSAQNKEYSNCSTNGLDNISENQTHYESQSSLKSDRDPPSLPASIETTGEAAEEEEEEDGTDRQTLEAEMSADENLRCKSCQWPKPRIHLRNFNSTQRIQLKWIETNLMGNLEENISQIKELSFKHGLWRVFLKCLTFSNELDDYITCCMMLDDIRLLDDRFVITRREGDEIVDRILVHLSKKMELTKDGKEICLKCGNEFEMLEVGRDNQNGSLHHQEDELSFALVNVFENFMLRPNADMKKIIKCLMDHREFLNNSKIPATFYLKVIAFATLIANQSPLSRIRLNQLRGSSATPLL